MEPKIGLLIFWRDVGSAIRRRPVRRLVIAIFVTLGIRDRLEGFGAGQPAVIIDFVAVPGVGVDGAVLGVLAGNDAFGRRFS